MSSAILSGWRAQIVAAAIACVASAASLPAQRIPDINAPKRAATNAADAENARLSAQTGQDLPARRGRPVAPKASGPGSAPAASRPAAAGAQTPVPSGAPRSPASDLTREVFSYDPAGRRDPFFSLILTEDLRPLLSDLKLVGIVYDATGRRSVAMMRDLQSNAQYRVNIGSTLGRMRVAQIKPRAVIFTIDEFGMNRLDSLFMADSTKRIR